jgi:hypothetical protein
VNDLGFDIDETDFDAQSRGVGVDAARPILLACFTKLVDEALTYHTLDAQAQAYRQYRQMINAQRPGETLHEYWWRVWYGPDGMWSAARAPVVPAPAQSGIRNTTGGGKSTAFRQVIAARYIPEAKRLQLPHRVLIAVPTHKLAAEARTKMPDGVTVAIWQGLKATKLGTNEPMCLNHAAVDAALALDVETPPAAWPAGRTADRVRSTISVTIVQKAAALGQCCSWRRGFVSNAAGGLRRLRPGDHR